ncbi:MAG: FAD-binding oxidoreductase [Pseudomonadota bacterium]
MDDQCDLAGLLDLLGDRGWLTDPTDVAPYTRDWRGLADGRALAVVRPRSTAEVVAVVRHCAATGTAIVPQGGLTGLVNGSAPHGPRSMVVLSLERMDRVIEVDPVNQTLTAEAGCILHDAQRAALDVGCRLPLRIGSEGSCRLGGNLSTNAGGNLTLRYGNTRDLCLGLEVVLPDGRVLDELKVLRKDNTGYDLKQLFIGAEGTLGIITKASLRLVPAPKQVTTALLALPSLDRLFDLLGRFRRGAGDHLSVFELMPRVLVELVCRHLPGCRDPLDAPSPWYVLVELETAQTTPDLNDLVAAILEPALEQNVVTDGVIAASEAQAAELRRLRENASEAQKEEGYSAKHDVAVPIDRLVRFIEEATAEVHRRLPTARVIAFGHVGDGNVHFNVQCPAGEPEGQALREQTAALAVAMHARAVGLGGTFSAEHGIGRIKRDEFAAYRGLKRALCIDVKRWLDPGGIMNPDVLVAERDLPR